MIEITRTAKDALTQEVWDFDAILDFASSNVQVVLRSYRTCARKTRRHVFQTVESYDRLDKRNHSIKDVKNVPLPDDVQQEAKAAVTVEVTLTYVR